MKKKIIFFALILLGAYSCLKDTENKDHDQPSLSDIRFNANDTIRYRYRTTLPENGLIVYKKDSTRINRKEQPIDTVVFGQPILFSGHFTDNDYLSSCKMEVLLKLDTAKISKLLKNNTDSLYLLQTFSVTGQDSIVTNFKGDKFVTSDSISQQVLIVDDKPSKPKPEETEGEEETPKPQYEWKLLAVKEGVYTILITVMDRGGNKASFNHDVQFVNFATFKKNRKLEETAEHIK